MEIGDIIEYYPGMNAQIVAIRPKRYSVGVVVDLILDDGVEVFGWGM